MSVADNRVNVIDGTTHARNTVIDCVGIVAVDSLRADPKKIVVNADTIKNGIVAAANNIMIKPNIDGSNWGGSLNFTSYPIFNDWLKNSLGRSAGRYLMNWFTGDNESLTKLVSEQSFYAAASEGIKYATSQKLI